MPLQARDNTYAKGQKKMTLKLTCRMSPSVIRFIHGLRPAGETSS